MCRQWSDRLLHQFQTDEGNIDCVLVAEDGSRVEGHRILLASVSGLLADVLSGHQEENDGDEVVTVLVPAAGEVLHQLVTWIYFGALPKSRIEVVELARFLRVRFTEETSLHNKENVEITIAENESLVVEESCTTFLYVEDGASKPDTVEEDQSKFVKSAQEETSSTMLYVEERCEEEEDVL